MNSVKSEDLFQLKSVSQPVKLGSKVFFVETQARKKDNDYISKIVSIDIENNSRMVWGDSGSVNTNFEISPNQKQLAYISNENEKTQLYVISLDGGAARALTNEEYGISDFQWSKDSKNIYYQTSSYPEIDEEFKSFPQRFTSNDYYYKRDGSGLNPQDGTFYIKKVDVETDDKSTLVKTDTPFSFGHISEDETDIYVTAGNDLEDDKEYGSNIYRFNIAEEAFIPLLDFEKGTYSFVDITDDESKILYAGNDMVYGIVQYSDLYIYDVASESSVKLTGSLDQEVGDVISGDFQQQVEGFAPTFLTKDKVIFNSSYHGTTQIYTATAQGEIEKIVDEENHIYDGSVLVGKSEFAIAYSTPTKPGVIAVVNGESGSVSPIYNPNADYEVDHQIQDPERFWFDGADNRKTQGWYFPPVEAKENHPVILYIHGGPQVAYGETFFHEMQVLASQGYGVINLNPRGSGSYGQMGAYAIVGDYGNNDFNDLMHGVDYVLENHPEIDEENMFVAGGSYGGFMTNWIVGHTDRFKAAITQRSISNWVSFFGTSDIGPVFVKENLQADLSNPRQLWRMSPLAYVGDVKTPVLVQHSENDLRCPMEQGEQFYVGLKDRGVEAEFVRYPESSHGLSREGLPNLRMDRMKDITVWLDKHYG